MKIRTMVFIALMAVSGQSKAAFYTGNELLTYCESELIGEENICVGYLIGIDDVIGVLEDWNLLIRREFCIPVNVIGKQLKLVFIKYLNVHPEKLHFSASSLAMNAFNESFPCK